MKIKIKNYFLSTNKFKVGDVVNCTRTGLTLCSVFVIGIFDKSKMIIVDECDRIAPYHNFKTVNEYLNFIISTPSTYKEINNNIEYSKDNFIYILSRNIGINTGIWVVPESYIH